MKSKLLFLILFVGFNMFSQTDSKWQFGIEFSLDNLSNVNILNIDGNEFGYLVNFDKTNYSFGIKSIYKLNQKFRISSGVLYSNKDFSGLINCTTCEFFVDAIPVLIKQRFLNIPISIIYEILDGKVKPNVELGINNNIEINNDFKRQSKKYFLEGFLGVSIIYEINGNWDVGLGYKYQTALSDLYKSNKFNLNTNSVILKLNLAN